MNKRHIERIKLNRQIHPSPKTNAQTASKCLNRMRKRASKSIPGDIMGDSFEHALDSADGAEIFSIVEKGNTDKYKAIVRNVKESWQQDTKYISAPGGVGFTPGNTITWDRLGVNWLIMWQDYNFSSFFKGEMFRASHLLSWKDSHGQVIKQWASIRGPVETKAKFDNVSGNYLGGRQNDTLDVWIGANNEEAIKSLARFDKIKVGTRTWKIQVRDDISNDNILRLSCIENFNNEYTDDVVNSIPGGMVEFPEDTGKAPVPDDTEKKVIIVGASTIKEGFSRTFVARVGSDKVVGDFRIFRNGIEKEAISNVSEMVLKGGGIGDVMEIEFSQDGEVKAHVRVPVVSMFG